MKICINGTQTAVDINITHMPHYIHKRINFDTLIATNHHSMWLIQNCMLSNDNTDKMCLEVLDEG